MSRNIREIQGGLNMTGINCDLFTHKQSRSYLNHLVQGPKLILYWVCVTIEMMIVTRKFWKCYELSGLQIRILCANSEFFYISSYFDAAELVPLFAGLTLRRYYHT